MRTSIRQKCSVNRQHGRQMNSGFAFIELLLLVALVTVLSALALLGVANQHNAAMQNEAEVSSIMAQQASEWMPMELGDGGRVWVRKI